MAFLLIQEDPIYKKVETKSGGQYFNGIWFEGTVTTTYEEIEGLVDPYNDSETSLVLPEGLSNEDARLLYTDEILLTHTSLDSQNNLADIVYLTDPETDTSAVPYTIYEKSEFSKNRGFVLIESYHGVYMIIRANKV